MDYGDKKGYTHAVISGEIDAETAEWYYYGHTTNRCGKKYDSHNILQPSLQDFLKNNPKGSLLICCIV